MGCRQRHQGKRYVIRFYFRLPVCCLEIFHNSIRETWKHLLFKRISTGKKEVGKNVCSWRRSFYLNSGLILVVLRVFEFVAPVGGVDEGWHVLWRLSLIHSSWRCTLTPQILVCRRLGGFFASEWSCMDNYRWTFVLSLPSCLLSTRIPWRPHWNLRPFPNHSSSCTAASSWSNADVT